MNAQSMTATVVGLAITIILMATFFMPVYSEYTTAEKTYTNEGMPYAAADEDTHTITVTSSEITVDGDTIDQNLFPSGFTAYTIVYGDSSFIRYIVNNSTIQYCYTAQTAFAIGDDTITITITGDSATITTTADNTTATMSDVLYYVSSEGPYVLSNCPYVVKDSILYGGGSTFFSSSGSTVYTVWTGTIEGITAEAIRSTVGTAVVSSVDVNTTNTTTNLYKIDSVLIDYTITVSNTDYEETSTYTYFLAPAEVVYDSPSYLGEGNAAILSALPILLIAGIVIASVAFVATGRRD